MVPYRLLIPCLVASACWASEADTGAWNLQVADGSRILEHWQHSLYAKIIADSSFAEFRNGFSTECTRLRDQIGFDPRELLSTMANAEVSLNEITADASGTPRLQMTAKADFGELSSQVMKYFGAQNSALRVEGADEALSLKTIASGQSETLARYGKTLVVGLNQQPVKPPPGKPLLDADLSTTLKIQRVLNSILAVLPKETVQALSMNALDNEATKGTYRYSATLVPEGILERLSYDKQFTILKPVDRDLLLRLPDTTILAIAIGVDGKAMWKQNRSAWLSQAATALSNQQGAPVTPEEAEQDINDQIAQTGIHASLQELIEGFVGTSVIAIGQGVPFPTLTIAFPRSKAIDESIAFGMQQLQAEPPPEGSSALLPIPNVPLAINIICDKACWVISSDPIISSSWSSGTPGGYSDSPAGKLALSKAPTDSTVIGSSDTSSFLRMASGYMNLILGSIPSLNAKQKQQYVKMINKVASLANPGYLNVCGSDHHEVLESRGLLGLMGWPVAAGIFAGFKEAEHVTPETAVVNTLKMVICPAESLFQTGGYLDQNGNGIGEYAFLSELSGLRPVEGTAKLNLVSTEVGSGSSGGYHYIVYLPNADGTALVEPVDQHALRVKDAKAASAQEKHWVAYAWPEDDQVTQRMFAVTEDGIVRDAPFTGEAPLWSDVFGGQGWEAKPVWQPYRR